MTAALLLLGAILILTVYPLRIYKENHVFETGTTVTESSGLIYDIRDTGATFIADYAHLDTLSIYIAELPWEGELYCNVYDLTDPVMPKNLTMEVAMVTEDMVPGFVTFTMDLDLTPGAEYTYIVTGGNTYGAIARAGFVSDAENEGDNLPILVHSIYHDSALEGKSLISRYTYRMPIKMFFSFILMAIYAALTLALVFLLRWIAGRGKILQGTWSLREGLRITLTPVIILSAAALLYLIVIRQLFDRRIPDITAFSVGTILTAAILLFALFRKPLQQEKEMDGKLLLVVLPEWIKENASHFLFSAFFAYAFHCTFEYMNGTSNIAHYIAEEKMLVFLALACICTLQRKDLLNPFTLLWTILSAGGGIIYYQLHKLSPEMKEFEENNLLLRLLIYLAIAAGVFLIGVGRRWIRRFRENDAPRLSKWFVAVLLLFFAVIAIFRYTRWWPVILVITFLLWADCYLSYEERRRTMLDIGRGVLFEFMYMTGFSLLFRVYLSYRFIRFPMGFHTVTVTAVYLTVVIGVAASFLIRKYWLLKREGYGYKTILAAAWKEIVFFGIAVSYLMMTMSRTGILAAFAILFMLLAAVALDRKEGRGMIARCGQVIGMMAVGFFLLLPSVFAMQRMLPALVSNPKVYELEEPDMMVEILRGDRYDSRFYICLERFRQVFGEKLFGAVEADSDDLDNFDKIMARRDAWNKENGMEVVEIYEISRIMNRLDQGEPIEIIQEEQRKKKEQRESWGFDMEFISQLETQGVVDYAAGVNVITEEPKEDYSNGRLDIFKMYLSSIGLKGHEKMGYPIDDEHFIVHAHNIYLQSAYDHGIFGGILLLLMLFVAFLRSVMYYYRKKNDPETLSFLPMAMTVGFAVTGLVEWVFHLCHPMTLLLFMCIIPLAEKEQDG